MRRTTRPTLPSMNPKPVTGTRGKSALAASRTGVPPAHGARRRGKTPGAPAGAFATVRSAGAKRKSK